MNNYYENLLKGLFEGANNLIEQTKNVNDKFDMSVRLAEQVIKAMKATNNVATIQQVVQAPEPVVVEQPKENVPMNKQEYEEFVGYPISQEAYDEYVDIYNRRLAGEEIKTWIPDPEGLIPIPEGVVVTLAVQEDPMYKHLFEEKEEVVEEEQEVEETQEPVMEIEEDELEDMIDTTVIESKEMTVEEAVEKALAEEDNGIEIDIDSDPAEEEPTEVIAEIDGENMDITEQYQLMKSFNNELSYDELVERAVEWVEFGINEETYKLLNFVEDDSAEMIQCKTYLAYYIDAMSIDDIVYYINYFASNIEEDEDGNEVYVNEELQLEFLNKDNISAFLEYVQQNQQ
jgi:hypothetical protein